MAGPKDVTVPPPPRRRSEDRLPEARPSPPPPSSEPDRERLLRELRDVEERSRAATQQAFADLSGAFERQLADRDDEIAKLRQTIRSLQTADTTALLQLGELSASIAATVTLEVKRQLNAQAAAEGAEAGESAGKAAGGTAGKKWAGAGAFVGTVIATLLASGVHRGCSATEGKPAKPAVQQPATGPGYGGRL